MIAVSSFPFRMCAQLHYIVDLFSIFLRTSILFSVVVGPNYLPTHTVCKSSFFFFMNILTNTCFRSCLNSPDSCLLKGCEVVCGCGFDLHLIISDSDIISRSVGHFVVLFGKMSYVILQSTI